MFRTIQQSVVLPAGPERLFDMYMNPENHAAFTGAPVTIGSESGSEFRAFNHVISGTILYTEPKCLIVQSWRASHWTPQDMDSILVLTFLPEGQSGRIELVHVNVAEHDFQGVEQGWQRYYWKPWRQYLLGE
ncbi:MAG: SRPBCC domain-containing protein [Deltaproteobacteria bacterium]|nr:MAG: SRPBCC domain-containing protein [Deltaproteobacteria bacterium]